MNTTTTLLPPNDSATRSEHGPPGPGRTAPPVVWRPWASRGWPATAVEETAFLDDLRRLSGDRRAAHRRAEITACLNALRSGLTAAEVLDAAPGLRPDRLLDAYLALDEARAASARAWYALVAAGDADALLEHGELAARLLPGPVGRLAVAARTAPDGYAVLVHRLAVNVAANDADIGRVEAALAACTRGSERGAELGSLLYHPHGDAFANRDDHLPQRLGTLSPQRVAALLGEQRSDVLERLRERLV